MNIKLITLSLFLVASQAMAASKTIYVAPNGNDAKTGGKSTPVKTLERAMQLAEPGSTVFLRGGVYRRGQSTQIIRRVEGRPSSPINVQAYPGEKVVFDGTLPVKQLAIKHRQASGRSAWQHHSGNIYKIQLDRDIWQLFWLKGSEAVQMVPARWPNAKFSDGSIYRRDVWATAKNAVSNEGRHSSNPVMNKIKTGVSPQQAINACFKQAQGDLSNLAYLQSLRSDHCFATTIDAPPEAKRQLTAKEAALLKKKPWKKINNNADPYGHDLAEQTFDATGAMAILNYGHWRTWARPVIDHDGDSFVHLATPHLYGTGHYYYLENALSLLDQEEEWYYDKDSKTLYFWAPGGVDLTKHEMDIRGKVQANAFEIVNAKHLHFSDLNFFATAFTCSRCDNMVFDSLNMDHAGSAKRMLKQWAQLRTNQKGQLVLDDVKPDIVMIEGRHTRKSTQESGSIIRNSQFTDVDGPVLQFHGNGNKIINNHFENIDYSGAEGWPFQAAINTFRGRDNLFSHNTFINSGLSQMYRGLSGDISFNLVDNIGWAQTDGAVIGANSIGLAVSYNWALSDHDKGIRIDAPFPPKHLDEWNTNNYVHHNVTMGNRGIVIKGWKHRVYNNTVTDIGYLDPYTNQPDSQPNRLVLNNDTGLVKRFKVGDSLGCEVGINCGANLETISANNLAPYIVSGLGNKIDRRYPILATQLSDVETDSANLTVGQLLNNPQQFDFRPKKGNKLLSQGVELSQFPKTESYSDYHGLPDHVDYIGAYSGTAQNYNIPGQRMELTSFPIPLTGSDKVPVDTDLMWREARVADEYRLYLDSDLERLEKRVDANLVRKSEFLTEYGLNQTQNIFQPGPLKPNQQYYWRVDVVVGDQVLKGDTWQFKTKTIN